jgi:hypothetical protein
VGDPWKGLTPLKSGKIYIKNQSFSLSITDCNVIKNIPRENIFTPPSQKKKKKILDLPMILIKKSQIQ